MNASRGFLYEQPMLGHNVFEALPVDYDLGQAAPIVVTPSAPVIVDRSPAMTLGTLAAIAAVGFLALEVTGVTHVLGLKKYMR